MFLYRKKEALTPEFCNILIETFETSDLKKPGVLYGKDGFDSEGFKKSTDISFHPGYLEDNIWGPLLKELIPIIEKGKADYMTRYWLGMERVDPFEINSFFNIQRYYPSEGFLGFHCERAGLKHSNRILAWMVYLNDVTDAGETEFFYQNHFEEAEQGKLVIWPSDWTHMHRGIPSPTQTKYIITGWFTHLKE